MQQTKAEYIALFAGLTLEGTKQGEALKQALDIRKFEIDTYWKRGAYFWALIAASFAAFFVLNSDNTSAEAYLVSCMGLLFSTGWYLSNRGSSSWQRNWEAQVDLLEDEIMGPLHKNVINHRTYRFLDLAGPFGYSPSRINTILSLVVTIIWAALLIRVLASAVAKCADRPFLAVVSMISLATLGALFVWGRSSPSDQPREIDVRTRVYR